MATKSEGPVTITCNSVQTSGDNSDGIQVDGENFIVHREGTEATPYLPNAIMTSNPYVRPDDYGIPITAQHHDDKHVRNIKLALALIVFAGEAEVLGLLGRRAPPGALLVERAAELREAAGLADHQPPQP